MYDHRDGVLDQGPRRNLLSCRGAAVGEPQQPPDDLCDVVALLDDRASRPTATFLSVKLRGKLLGAQRDDPKRSRDLVRETHGQGSQSGRLVGHLKSLVGLVTGVCNENLTL